MKPTSIQKIIFYDFCNFYYSAPILTGFVELADDYVFQVSHKVPDALYEIDLKGKEGIFKNVLLFRASFLNNEELWFCVDISDTSNLNAIHLPLLDRVSIYFKVNLDKTQMSPSYWARSFPQDTADDMENLEGKWIERRAKLRPIMPCSPLRGPLSLAQLPRLRTGREVGWKARDTLSRFRQVYNTPTIEKISRMRDAPKEYDVVFLTTHYDSAGYAAQMDFREELIRRLRENRRLHCRTGFVSNSRNYYRDPALIAKPMKLTKYLALVARGRVGIYVRGLKDCASFKLTQMLSLGLPMVGQPLKSPHHYPEGQSLLNDYLRFESPSSIVSQVEKILEQPALQEQLSKESLELFDKAMSPTVIVQKIVMDLISVNCSGNS